MNRTGTLLIIWNLVLTALLAWALLRAPGGTQDEAAVPSAEEVPVASYTLPDSLRAIPEAPIADDANRTCNANCSGHKAATRN